MVATQTERADAPNLMEYSNPSVLGQLSNTCRRRWRTARRFIGLRERHPRPHFLGVGTQKGGTSSLYHLLKQHPDLYLPDNKEIHYFTKFYERGDDWYREQFEAAPAGLLRGEITPFYLFHEAVPDRIHALRHDMKIIVLLRNPVDRTLSQYFHSCRWNLETLPLEKALAAEPERLKGALNIIRQPGGTHLSYQEHSYLARSRYEEQLPRYLRLFGRNQVLVLRSDGLYDAERKTLESITQFLNIRPFPDNITIPFENQGAGEAEKVSPEVRKHIAKQLESTFNWLEQTLDISW